MLNKEMLEMHAFLPPPGLYLKHTITFIGQGLLAGRWDFGLCSQQQFICVILLLLHRLASLINTAISIQGLPRKTQREQGRGESRGKDG